MVFSSIVFIVYFLPILLFILYFSSHKYRNDIILIASFIFYIWGSPQFFLVMLSVIIINYLVGIYIEKYDKIINKNKNIADLRKRVLIVGIIINLSVLFIFKYLNFSRDNINIILEFFNISPIVFKNIVLPIGISFYIFQSISYLVDVYRGEVKAQKSFRKLALYISMFPQLVAGPIVRYSTIFQDIDRERNITIDTVSLGIKIFIIGLAKKVLIANNIGNYADSIYNVGPEYIDSMTAWIGAISYSFQIYFDFSGYSDMAIGLGILLGFKFPINFNYPYISYSFTDFWRRWHMSLSTWFRDYVYIPLGGNRVSSYRMYYNLFIVFLLTGIWHGANWTFIAWGLFHGFFLFIEKITGFNKYDKFKILRGFITFILVSIAWVFFRSNNIHDALNYIYTMFGIYENKTVLFDIKYFIWEVKFPITILISLIGIFPILKKYLFSNITLDGLNNISISKYKNIIQNVFILLVFILSIILLVNESYNPFIYFQF